jgi:hypothetical protein
MATVQEPARADAPLTATFTLGADGRATAMVVRQEGRARMPRRVP